MNDDFAIDPDGAQQARDVADRSDRAMLRLRLSVLALVLISGFVLASQNAAHHAVWLIPTIPLFFNADFRYGGTAAAYRAVALQHEGGDWEVTPVNDILRGTYRHEFYGLLALGLLLLTIRS